MKCLEEALKVYPGRTDIAPQATAKKSVAKKTAVKKPTAKKK
jgi:hypothetical protein